MDSVEFDLIERAKEKIKTMQNEDIKFCNYIKLKNQLKQIENSMLSGYFLYSNKYFGDIPYKFDLFNCECSTGKTFSVVTKSILFLERWVMCRDEKDIKGMLFVMQNIATCKYYSKMINKDLLENTPVAETIDSSMKADVIKQKLQKYPIIFLTHEKYKILAQDEEQRKQFSCNRILLIIDEFINMCKKIWISNIEYDKLVLALEDVVNLQNDKEIMKKFCNATKELKYYLLENKKNKNGLHIKNFQSDYTYIAKVIDKIKGYIRNNPDTNSLTEYYNSNNKRSIYNVLDEIKEFFGGTCLLENGKLYTIKRDLQLWGLNKNIILDGSGTLNYAYYLQKDKINFKLNKDYEVLDHQNFTIEQIKINTTKTSKKAYSNFYNICREILGELGKSQTLVVCAKYEHKDKNGNEITDYFDVPFINYWQNFLGSNDYGNLKNMLIIDTFNITEKDFILEYLYYSNVSFTSDEDIKVLTKDNHRYFTNAEIEEYKNRRIANEFYQAFKRVNRKLKHITKIVIITKHTEAVMLACKMLKNCKYIDITEQYDGRIKYKEEYKKNTKTNGRITKAKEILEDIINDNFQYKDIIRIDNNKKILSKKQLSKLIGIDKAPNFRRDILSKQDFKNFLNENDIENKGQNLIIPIKRSF